MAGPYIDHASIFHFAQAVNENNGRVGRWATAIVEAVEAEGHGDEAHEGCRLCTLIDAWHEDSDYSDPPADQHGNR